MRRTMIVVAVTCLMCALAPGALANPLVVATVGGTPITQATYQRWLAVANASVYPSAPVPEPPDYTACVKYERIGTPRASRAARRESCAELYASLSTQVMQFLISADWLIGEASDEGLSVSYKTVVATFDQEKREQFPNPGDYESFLASSDETLADLLYRVKLNLLSSLIQGHVESNAATPSLVAAYYAVNQSHFTLPAHRFAQIIVTASLRSAQHALGELRHGASFAKVASTFSIDAATRNRGGATGPIYDHTYAEPLNSVILRARRGVLNGPLAAHRRYYVFRVVAVVAAALTPLDQVSQNIAMTLDQTALTAFLNTFNTKWKALTVCSAAYFDADDCGQVL